MCAVQGGKRSQEEGVVLATQFSKVVHMLLSVVPMSSILAVSDTVMAEVEEEEEAAQPQASTSGSSGELAVWLRIQHSPRVHLTWTWVWFPCLRNKLHYSHVQLSSSICALFLAR